MEKLNNLSFRPLGGAGSPIFFSILDSDTFYVLTPQLKLPASSFSGQADFTLCGLALRFGNLLQLFVKQSPSHVAPPAEVI